MTQMYPCERVGLELIDTARFCSRNSVDLPIAPDKLWQVLEDAETWPRWSFVTKMSWTSPRPFRVGTTREIQTRSGTTVHDEVIAWRPHSHMAFRMKAISERIEGASVEELRIEPTPQGCRLTWTLAHNPAEVPLMARLFAKRAMNSKYREYLANLRRYIDQRFGMSI